MFFPELNKANKNTDFHKTNIVLNANMFTNENGNIAVQKEFIKSSKHGWKINWENDTEKLKWVFSFSGKVILF